MVVANTTSALGTEVGEVLPNLRRIHAGCGREIFRRADLFRWRHVGETSQIPRQSRHCRFRDTGFHWAKRTAF